MAELCVAILTRNEERNLPELLESLVAQNIDRSRFCVMVVDNTSSDHTVEIARSFADRLPGLRVVDNSLRGIAISRNLALREAQQPLIAFTDADCVVPPHWVGRLLEGYRAHHERDAAVVAVGGGNVPLAGQGRFMDALGITLRSFFGSHGSVQGMVFERDRDVEHIPTLNILYDRERVLGIGGFDEKFLMVSEDPELNHRLRNAGLRIVYLADCVVQHKMRPDLRSWLRNVKLYGRGRTQIIRKHPDHFQLKFLVPPLVVLCLALTPLGLLWRPLALPLCYFVATLLLAAALAIKARRIDCLGWAWVILSLNPIAYGLGMIQGFFKPQPGPDD
ncbi:MAG: glycosyltransferase [Candidatus Alcyoniella australis]|nr:glycosyltransferase [Candidatus Alcyoniella australis]